MPRAHLQPNPVGIILTDVAVVASPVSDGKQEDLGVPEKRLKTANIATNESVRDVKFSLRNVTIDKVPVTDESSKNIQPNRFLQCSGSLRSE